MLGWMSKQSVKQLFSGMREVCEQGLWTELPVKS